MGLLSSLLSLSEEIDRDKKKKEKEKLEREMKAYDLEEWQKKLVREEKYDVNNFEEDAFDEDHYYHADD